MTRRHLAALLMLLFTLAAAPLHAQERQTLIVFAAASLTDAFEEIAVQFEAAQPGADVLFNFAASSDLVAQLSEGAPADVFASANPRQMQAAVEAGRIGGAARAFVKNRLVVIVPSDNPAGVVTLRDLANEGLKLVLPADGLPVRDYTNTLLERLAADSHYGEDYRAAVLANVVSEERTVRLVAAKIALGEADAGVVYVSDVTPDLDDEVSAIPVPDYLNTIATYPIAITDNASNPALAQDFVDFVLSDAGQDILVKWNFISVRIPPVPAVIDLPAEPGVVQVDGQVLNPLMLTVESLRADFSPQTIDVTYLSGEESVSASFTGVPLWQIVSAAQPNFNADVRGDAASTFIVVTGSDGAQAVIAWGEIDPDLGAQPVLVAYEQDGAPIATGQGPLRLVVPGDRRPTRYIDNIASISLRDAPPVTR